MYLQDIINNIILSSSLRDETERERAGERASERRFERRVSASRRRRKLLTIHAPRGNTLVRQSSFERRRRPVDLQAHHSRLVLSSTGVSELGSETR